MQIKIFAIYLFVSVFLSTIIYAQPEVTGRCVTISQARAGGISGTDCELFEMGFCPDTKTSEEQYWECYGKPTDAKDTIEEPIDYIIEETLVYPPGMYYNNYEIALYEYETIWENGGRKESDPVMASIIEDYNSAGGCPGNSPTQDPWSAAFISYVMVQTGMDFPASCSHIGYFNNIKNDPGACKTYPMTSKNQIDVGDIICRCRPETGKSTCKLDYNNLPGSAPAHCDIVTSKNGDNIEIVGGNVAASSRDPNAGVTVNKRTRKIPQLGADYFGFISCAGMGKPLEIGGAQTEVPPPKTTSETNCPLALIFLIIPFYQH